VRVKIIDYGKDWIKIEGEPLPDFFENFVIVNAQGIEIGPVIGFAAIKGKTMKECLEASLPEGCTVVCKPRPIQ
jgi:hypothetical protein